MLCCPAGGDPGGDSGHFPQEEVVMYKKQLKIQKIVCLLSLVVAVILFLYALGIMTDLYDSLYSALRIRVEEDSEAANGYTITATERSVPGAMVYFNMQDFNKTFVSCSIVYIVLAALLYVTNTSTRRRYYISNYISIGLVAVASLAIPIYAHSQIEAYKAQFLQIDFAALKEYSNTFGTLYTESTMWFDLHYFVFALMILVGAALVGVCAWKVVLMREESRLVEEGKKVKV